MCLFYLDYVERFTNGSIYVNPETCIIYFEPGKIHKFTIELKNETTLIQTIQIEPLEDSVFRIPNLFTVSDINKYIYIHYTTYKIHI